MKVRNLKANHSDLSATNKFTLAVLASMKVRNLKANHSLAVVGDFHCLLY